jgi:hypothetical protein
MGDDFIWNPKGESAAEALIKAGQADKVREVIAGDEPKYATAAAQFGALMKQSDSEFRTKATQVLGSSGEFTFQEYAKHVGQAGTNPDDNTSKAMSFREWSNNTNGLRKSIEDKGLDKIDKDGFDFLSKHMTALEGASNDNIAKVAASTTDAATVAKLTQAISTLSDDKKKEVIQATSAAQFVNMNENVRIALSNGNNEAWRAQVGAALAADPQLRGRLNQEEQSRYVGASTTQPTPTTHDNSPRDFGSDGSM